MKLFAPIAAAMLLALAGASQAIAQMAPFHWLESATIALTNNNSSTNAALLRMPTGVTQIRVASNCATWMYIKKGTDSTVTATASDLPIAPGEVEVLTLQNNPTAPITYIAMISPSGSCTLYVTTGEGI
jgi:hypothetical protein